MNRCDMKFDINSPGYTPNKLINQALMLLNLKTDIELAHLLEIEQAVISRVRHKKHAVSPHTLIRIMDPTGLSIKEVRELAGIPLSRSKT